MKQISYIQDWNSIQCKGKHFCEPNMPAPDPIALLSDSTATPREDLSINSYFHIRKHSSARRSRSSLPQWETPSSGESAPSQTPFCQITVESLLGLQTEEIQFMRLFFKCLTVTPKPFGLVLTFRISRQDATRTA